MIDTYVLILSARQRFGEYWRSHYASASDLHKSLAEHGVLVAKKTSRNWFNGESLPKPTRLQELILCGHPELIDVIFSEAISIGDAIESKKRREKLTAKIERLESEIEQLEMIDSKIT